MNENEVCAYAPKFLFVAQTWTLGCSQGCSKTTHTSHVSGSRQVNLHYVTPQDILSGSRAAPELLEGPAANNNNNNNY